MESDLALQAGHIAPSDWIYLRPGLSPEWRAISKRVGQGHSLHGCITNFVDTSFPAKRIRCWALLRNRIRDCWPRSRPISDFSAAICDYNERPKDSGLFKTQVLFAQDLAEVAKTLQPATPQTKNVAVHLFIHLQTFVGVLRQLQIDPENGKLFHDFYNLKEASTQMVAYLRGSAPPHTTHRQYDPWEKQCVDLLNAAAVNDALELFTPLL